MDIINNNPYRLLGVYANASAKERVANLNKCRAFLKVGKPINFGLDLLGILPPLQRDAEQMDKAESSLALPQDQLAYALFWFIKRTPIDEIACKRLEAGDLSAAVALWAKKDNLSSLHNRCVCALIGKNYSEAVAYAERIYPHYEAELVEAILGDLPLEGQNLGMMLVDKLAEALGVNELLGYITREDWREHLAGTYVQPLMTQILEDIAAVPGGRNKPQEQYEYAERLMKQTYPLLQQLADLLSKKDAQYQMIADKLGLQILQCGINFFNDSERTKAARKAMRVQRFASKVVASKSAKQRCKENVDILQGIIDKLPPREVEAEFEVVEKALRKFNALPDKIEHSRTLIDETKSSLQAIRRKLGASHVSYLNLSTRVVRLAMHNLVEEVNKVQADVASSVELLGLHSRNDLMDGLKNTFRNAWEVTNILDAFDLEDEYRKRFNENKNSLRNLCQQVGVSTLIISPRSTRPSTSSRPSSFSTRRVSPQTLNSQSVKSNESGRADTIWGLIIFVVIIVVIMFFFVMPLVLIRFY